MNPEFVPETTILGGVQVLPHWGPLGTSLIESLTQCLGTLSLIGFVFISLLITKNMCYLTLAILFPLRDTLHVMSSNATLNFLSNNLSMFKLDFDENKILSHNFDIIRKMVGPFIGPIGIYDGVRNGL